MVCGVVSSMRTTRSRSIRTGSFCNFAPLMVCRSTVFRDVYSVDVGLLDDVAERRHRSGMKVAAIEGAGFGLGWDRDHCP